MKLSRKLLASLLILSLIFGMVPNTNIQKEATVNAETQIIPQIDTTKQQATVIGEVDSLRDKNNKHFRMSDGTISAAMYTEAVHYLKDGKWEEIDNSLSDSQDKNGKSLLENKNNSYKVNFAKEADSKNLVNFTINSNKISWGLEKKQ